MAQYVDLAVEYDVATSQILHTVWTNNPTQSSKRFNKMALTPWDDSDVATTDYSNGVCDSNHGAQNLPGKLTTAGANYQAFSDAQYDGVTAGEWTRIANETATRVFVTDGVSNQVSGLTQYLGKLGLEEIRDCSATETETFVGGTGGSVERKLKYYL